MCGNRCDLKKINFEKHVRIFVLSKNKLLFGFIIFYLCSVSHADIADPCEKNILAVFRRPTVISSACTTPLGKYTFESGLQYTEFTHQVSGFMFPQSKIRAGLPGRNEITLVIPNENINTKIASGLSTTQLTVKHNIFYDEHWNAAVRGVYIPASGSNNYGTSHDGYTLNGIVSYRIDSFNASVMLGYSSYSTAAITGGKRFNTFSPDAAIGWQAKEWLQLYAEVFGQTFSGPNQGPGYNIDTGLLFLITKNIEADIEVGHRISGRLGNFNVYYGTGFGVLF